MALYNLALDADYVKVLAKIEKAKAKGVYIEVIEKADQTLNQNAYLHVCLAYFADYFGYSPEYVKNNFFKIRVNPELFVIDRKDRFGRVYKDVRHSSDLTKEEMSQAIDRWCAWCIETADLPMPDPDDYKVLMWLRKNLENKKSYQ